MDDFDKLALTLKPIKRKPKPVRESKIEDNHVAGVKAEGGLSYKFTSPGHNGVPDRLDLRPIPEAVRHIVSQYVRFTELKRPGQKPRPDQLVEHERIRALGFQVDVKDYL